ncbi:MAG: Hpt domain-containing protein [Hyphomonadaceae bacterium]
MSKPQVQFIDPKEFDRAAVELKKPVFDAGAVARAEEALKAMSGSFQQWLDEEVTKLQAARLACEASGWSGDAIEALFSAAHDVKGLGATYEFPLATQIAASLCRLIETDAGRAVAAADPKLVLAHVDAIRAVVRDEVRTADHPVGRVLTRALEAQVAALGVAPR